MPMANVVSGVLPREACEELRELLRVLSPQGMAKVNTDISKGVSPEETVAQLKAAHEAAAELKALMVSFLPVKAQSCLLGQMRRPPTVDELELLAGAPLQEVENQVALRTKEGESLEEVIEDLAEAHRLSVLRAMGTKLAFQSGKAVVTTPLGPTQLQQSPRGLGPTVSVRELRKRRRLLLGPGAVASWFCELPSETTEQSG
eukprot:RCo031908